MSIENNDRQILDAAPGESELNRWATDGERRDYSNIVSWTDPNQTYLLEVTLDDPVQGYLVRLFRVGATTETRSAENRIAQTIYDDPDETLDACCRLAAAADELAAVDDDPLMGPTYPDLELVERPHTTPNPPDAWADLEDEWNEKMEAAIEKADEIPARPSLTKKVIDGSAYYYLQWRRGEKIETQYVAPAEP